MKTLIVSLILAFAISAAYADVDQHQGVSAYDYHRKFGIPKAERVKKAELAQLENGQSRIVGGQLTSIIDVPYQAGLLITMLFVFTSLCGGSVISNTRILTAAHCYTDGILTAQSFTVVLGSNTVFFGGHRVVTTDISVHPNYNAFFAANDIAVLRIPAVTLTNVIQPITLPSGAQLTNNFVGSFALASGWGLTSDGGSTPISQLISSVELPVITNQECASVYGNLFVHATNLCTSGEGGKGICSGDSGGPLVTDINGNKVLIGVSSYGADAGCEAGLPAAFARVTSFTFWINNQ